jgi:hypothetical protein
MITYAIIFVIILGRAAIIINIIRGTIINDNIQSWTFPSKLPWWRWRRQRRREGHILHSCKTSLTDPILLSPPIVLLQQLVVVVVVEKAKTMTHCCW